jgi:ATP-dependent helicase HepA
VQARRDLALDRVLGHEPLRILADVHGRNLAAQVNAANLAKQLDVPDAKLARTVIKAHRGDAEKLISAANVAAAEALSAQRDQALAAWQTLEHSELQRLQALALINPSVREAEITQQRERVAAGELALADVSMQLMALRLIIAA